VLEQLLLLGVAQPWLQPKKSKKEKSEKKSLELKRIKREVLKERP
jgi:hypothetical protein